LIFLVLAFTSVFIVFSLLPFRTDWIWDALSPVKTSLGLHRTPQDYLPRGWARRGIIWRFSVSQRAHPARGQHPDGANRPCSRIETQEGSQQEEPNDVIATAKANDSHKLRSLISERLMKMHGVKAVTTSVILHTYKLNGKEVFE
jgi:hypothetical protein